MLHSYYEASEIKVPSEELDKDDIVSVREWSTNKRRIKLMVEDDEKGRNARLNFYDIIWGQLSRSSQYKG